MIIYPLAIPLSGSFCVTYTLFPLSSSKASSSFLPIASKTTFLKSCSPLTVLAFSSRASSSKVSFIAIESWYASWSSSVPVNDIVTPTLIFRSESTCFLFAIAVSLVSGMRSLFPNNPASLCSKDHSPDSLRILLNDIRWIVLNSIVFDNPTSFCDVISIKLRMPKVVKNLNISWEP